MKKCIFVLFLLTLMMACQPKSTSSAFDSPAAKKFLIPRVQEMASGWPTIWADEGFQVAAMIDPTGRMPMGGEAGAEPTRFAVAWDSRGLLILVIAYNRHYYDIPNADPAMGDGIEIDLAGGPELKHRFGMVLTPGIPGGTPRCKYVSQDLDVASLPQIAEFKSRKVEFGYEIQVRVPWELLKVPPREGTRLGIRIATRDEVYDGRYLTEWSSNCMELAKKASAPDEIAASGAAFTRPRVLVAAPRRYLGYPVEVRDGNRTLANGTLDAYDGWTLARMFLPPPDAGKKYGRLEVFLDGVRRTDFELAAPPEVNDVFEQAGLGMRRTLIDDAFFGFEFKLPRDVEEAIGPYEIKTKFYGAKFDEVERPTARGRYGAVVEIHASGAVYRRFYTLYSADRKDDLDGIDKRITVFNEELIKKIRNDRKIAWFENERYAMLLAVCREADPNGPRLTEEEILERNNNWWALLKKEYGFEKEK